MKKVCFVISPIGEEGSQIRTDSDDLFEIVVSPVLKAHGFDVVRADKIPGSGVISDEIVSLIQSATLCVIDLTGHNANVYYECGRRHETGKPFIQLMQKGEKLPFDLGGIRTIFYELTSARTAHSASAELTRFVEDFERGGYVNEGAGVSLGALANTVDRIDRKLDQLRDGFAKNGKGTVPAAPAGGGLESLLASPARALSRAVEAGDYDGVRELFPRIRRLGTHSDELLLAANILSSNGEPEGVDVLGEILNTSQSSGMWKIATGGIVRFAQLRNSEVEILERFEEVLKGILDDSRALEDPIDRAFVANQLGILSDTAGDAEKSAAYGRRAIDLDPAELAYRVNLAIALEQFDMAEAVRVVDAYMDSSQFTLTRFALEEAIDVYEASDRRDDVRRAISLLDDVDPGAARTKRSQTDSEGPAS